MKKLLSHILAIFVGLFTFVALSFGFLKTFVKVDGKYVFQDLQAKITGYELMKLWDTDFTGIMTSLFLVLVVVLAVLLVLYGAFGLLKELGVLKCDCLNQYDTSKHSTIGLIGYVVLNVFVILFASLYAGKARVEVFDSVSGVRVIFGLFIPFIVAVLSVVAVIVVDKTSKEENECHCGCSEY